MSKIFIIDDDDDMCLLLTKFLKRHGYEAEAVRSGKEAVSWLKTNSPSLILCDFRLEDMTGVDLLARIKVLHHSVPVLIITGYGDVKDAVDVMKMGAYDYITKPLYPDEILVTINKALRHNDSSGVTVDKMHNTGQKSEIVREETENDYVIGGSEEFAKIMRQIDLVAPTNYSIIIYGESGSGKEVVAKQIHKHSKRAHLPFMAVDCGALSKELAASELFGHEKGAFTGAINQKIGILEAANSGTVFLDEIANLTYDTQVSLLRVVQERKIRRVGGSKDIELDLRIIVASNENLWEAARAGKFREDLYHRFNEFSINVPSLRERKSDILLFANHFLRITNRELGKNVKGFSDEVKIIFENYVWFGNLRELRNVVKRAALLSDGDLIEAKSLPFEINNYNKLRFDSQEDENTLSQNSKSQTESAVITEAGNKLKVANASAEHKIILEALKQANYNKSKAAVLLNIDRKTLYNKMKLFKDL